MVQRFKTLDIIRLCPFDYLSFGQAGKQERFLRGSILYQQGFLSSDYKHDACALRCIREGGMLYSLLRNPSLERRYPASVAFRSAGRWRFSSKHFANDRPILAGVFTPVVYWICF